MSAPRPEDAHPLSRLLTGGALLLLSLVAALVVAAPARAHTGLVVATPRAGAAVPAPGQLVLAFSEELLPSLAVVSLQGPSGAVDLPAVPEVSGRQVVQQLGALAAGEHRVRYRVVAGDGHPVTGETTFTVQAAAVRTAAGRSPAAVAAPTAPAPTAPTPTAQTPTAQTPTDDVAMAADRSSTTAAAGALLVVLGGAALVAWRRAARRTEAAGRG